MRLLALQREMRAWLTTDTEFTSSAFESGARAGLGVYQNNYRAQLVACLADTFPRVKSWLGDDDFLASAARHIDASPPSDWTLDRYGRNFPQTLRAHYPQDVEVAELAWLDRTLADAFVGADVQPVCPQLARRDRLGPRHSSAHIQTCKWVRYSRTPLRSGLHCSQATCHRRLSCLPKPATVLVWRKEFTSCFRMLSSSEEQAIAHARSGGTFGALCAMLVTTQGDTEGVKMCWRISSPVAARWIDRASGLNNSFALERSSTVCIVHASVLLDSRSTHLQQNIDRADEGPERREHQVHRMPGSASHSGCDHCGNAHRNTAADQQAANPAVDLAEHDKR